MIKVCKECGEKFELTDKDLTWYKEKGFSEPKRCKSCRALRRATVIGREDVDYGKKEKQRRKSF